MSTDTHGWRVQVCPDRRVFRYRVVDVARLGQPMIETFLTRRGAESFIRRNTWKDVR